jgi:hypothetical protein
MTRRRTACLALGLLAVGAWTADAQETGQPAAADEALAAWAWFQEVRLPPEPATYYALTVPPSVFGKAQADLRDLRLADADGQPVPYALRVLRTENRQVPVGVRRQFNEGKDDKQRFAQVSLELDAKDFVEHNEIEVATGGTNFRRRVEVRGGDNDRLDAALVIARGHVVRFEEGGKVVVDLRTLHYDFSRFRFLQVRVYADAGSGEEAPRIDKVTVRQAVRVEGRYVTRPAELGPREAVRGDGGPGSAWDLDLGEGGPCERLSFDVAEDEFDRPFRLETADPGEPRKQLAQGDWRRTGGPRQPLEVPFAETWVRRLRLVVTDFANAPLTLQAARATAAARQVIFALPREKKPARPLRLYFGNPGAEVPRYDFDRNLPAALQPPPREVGLGERRRNPAYRPPPQPLAERWPWLVHGVLGVASLALLGILVLLARQAMARHDAARPAP